MKDGTYGVDFNSYHIGYGNDIISNNKYYWYSDSNACNDYDCHFSNLGIAIVKPVVYNRKTHGSYYILKPNRLGIIDPHQKFW